MEDIMKRTAEKSKMLIIRELLLDGIITQEQTAHIRSKYLISIHLPKYRIDPKKYLYFLDIKSTERRKTENDILKRDIAQLKNEIKILEQELEERK